MVFFSPEWSPKETLLRFAEFSLATRTRNQTALIEKFWLVGSRWKVLAEKFLAAMQRERLKHFQESSIIAIHMDRRSAAWKEAKFKRKINTNLKSNKSKPFAASK